MASLVDYEDSDSDPEAQSAAPQPQLELCNDHALIFSSSSSSSSSSSVPQSLKRAQPAAVRPYVPKRQRIGPASARSAEAPDTCPSAGARVLTQSSCPSAGAGLLTQSSCPSAGARVLTQSSCPSAGAGLLTQSSCPSAGARVLTQSSCPSAGARVLTQSSCPSAGAGLLTQSSERVRMFLGRKPGRVELPKRLQSCLQAHQGPVNTLQWSPVEQLSHLLLSASMDHTCKVWDGVGGGRCLRSYSAHRGAVRDACWLPCGRRLLSGSFDGSAALTDVETGQTIARMENGFKVSCVAPRPSDPDVFLSGGFSSEVKAWDARSRKVLRVYKAAVQQTLDVLFLSGGREFVSSTDAVSRDSAERTLIAWDFETAAKLSNQIFHERYTCPSLSAHPLDDSFIAQTNGGYIALFSAQRPYRMNKRRRYEGHKVEGFAVHCGFSADGSVLVSGSSTGSVHFYDYQSSRTLKTLEAHEHACVCAALHPVLPAVTATCDWTGEIKIWT